MFDNATPEEKAVLIEKGLIEPPDPFEDALADIAAAFSMLADKVKELEQCAYQTRDDLEDLEDEYHDKLVAPINQAYGEMNRMQAVNDYKNGDGARFAPFEPKIKEAFPDVDDFWGDLYSIIDDIAEDGTPKIETVYQGLSAKFPDVIMKAEPEPPAEAPAEDGTASEPPAEEPAPDPAEEKLQSMIAKAKDRIKKVKSGKIPNMIGDY